MATDAGADAAAATAPAPTPAAGAAACLAALRALAPRPTFFRLHFAYFLALVLGGGGVLWALEGGGAGYVDCAFMAASAACVTGFIVLDPSALCLGSQLTLLGLMAAGATSTLSVVPVLLRRRHFAAAAAAAVRRRRRRRRVRRARGGDDGEGDDDDGGAPGDGDKRRSRRVADADADADDDVDAAARRLLAASPEYAALGAVLAATAAYTLCVVGAVTLALGVYTSLHPPPAMVTAGVHPWYFAVFHAVAAFANAGLSLLPDNMIPLRGTPGVLLPMAAACLAGTTCLPLGMRGLFLAADAWTRGGHAGVRFALAKPRRVYTHMFRPGPTRLLGYTFAAFLLLEWVLFLGLDWGLPFMAGDAPGTRVLMGFFQSVSTRTAGFNTLDVSQAAAGMQVVFAVLMYVAVYPISLTVRSTTTSATAAATTSESPATASPPPPLWLFPLPVDDASAHGGGFAPRPPPPSASDDGGADTAAAAAAPADDAPLTLDDIAAGTATTTGGPAPAQQLPDAGAVDTPRSPAQTQPLVVVNDAAARGAAARYHTAHYRSPSGSFSGDASTLSAPPRACTRGPPVSLAQLFRPHKPPPQPLDGVSSPARHPRPPPRPSSSSSSSSVVLTAGGAEAAGAFAQPPLRPRGGSGVGDVDGDAPDPHAHGSHHHHHGSLSWSVVRQSSWRTARAMWALHGGGGGGGGSRIEGDAGVGGSGGGLDGGHTDGPPADAAGAAAAAAAEAAPAAMSPERYFAAQVRGMLVRDVPLLALATLAIAIAEQPALAPLGAPLSAGETLLVVPPGPHYSLWGVVFELVSECSRVGGGGWGGSGARRGRGASGTMPRRLTFALFHRAPSSSSFAAGVCVRHGGAVAGLPGQHLLPVGGVWHLQQAGGDCRDAAGPPPRATAGHRPVRAAAARAAAAGHAAAGVLGERGRVAPAWQGTRQAVSAAPR